MASAGKSGTGKGHSDRAARERARLYQARTDFNAATIRRRRRDNLVGGIVAGLLVLGAFGAQSAYFLAGPGVPAPTAPTVDEAPDTETTPVPGGSDPAETTPAPAETTPAPSPSTAG